MKLRGVLLALAAGSAGLLAQTPCANAPVYAPCDLVFEMTAEEVSAHPNPYATVDLSIEFRSPGFDTLAMPAFWDGGRRMVVRFTPTEPGNWVYRISSNLSRFEGKTGNFTAVPSELPGFVQPRNVHHWAMTWGYTPEVKPHLWMGDTCYRFAFLENALFQKIADARAAQKFNHMRGLVLGSDADAARMVSAPDRLDPVPFQQLDERIKYFNGKGIIADLILGGPGNQLVRLFPTPAARERYVRYIVGRYAAMNVTWQGVEKFETYENGRALLKEIGLLLKKLDPYHHPRTTGTQATSGPLLEDAWMNFVAQETHEDAVGAIEHQLFAVPFVNLDFGQEAAGAASAGAVDTDTLRRRLWNATMDGQYVTYANAGTSGHDGAAVDAQYADSAGARQMTVWYDFFAGTRHWELEPYFDVDGGRALALEGVEYIVYVEKPGPVELLVEKHGYDVAWVNPLTGERTKEKGYKGEHYTGEPPDKSHDWVLHVSREGRKEGMLRSYKFESRRIEMQVIEQNTPKVPFSIVQPSQAALPVGQPVKYEVKITRPTHATRSMLWLWTGEVVAAGQGYRILGTSAQGSFAVPPELKGTAGSVLSLRLYGMNALGKVYSVDKPYPLSQ